MKAAEEEKARKANEKEAKTTVGAVKRLIQRVSSLSIKINDNLAMDSNRSSQMLQKKVVKRKSSRINDFSATDCKSTSRNANSSLCNRGSSGRDANDLVSRRVSKHDSSE